MAMQQLHSEDFTVGGRTFQIKTFACQDGLRAFSFLNGKHVSPPYWASFDLSYKIDAISQLVTLAKSDLEVEMYFKG
jgi:hypothetical protein